MYRKILEFSNLVDVGIELTDILINWALISFLMSAHYQSFVSIKLSETLLNIREEIFESIGTGFSKAKYNEFIDNLILSGTNKIIEFVKDPFQLTLAHSELNIQLNKLKI